MWKADYPKLSTKIREVWGDPYYYGVNTTRSWEKGKKVSPGFILKLENDLDIDFKDYIIVTKIPKSMSKRFILLREINGFTQLEFAAELGICANTLSYWEKKEAFVEDKLVELNEIFNCNKNYFREGGEPYDDKRIFL